MRTSPVFSRAERDFDAEHSRDVNVVLQVMQRQGELDARVECAKGTISTSIPLEGVFKELDRFVQCRVSCHRCTRNSCV